MRKFGEYILSNRWHAAAFALLFSFIPFFGWVGVVIMAFVTLRKGAVAGLIILGFIVIPDLIMTIRGYPAQFIFGIVLGSVFVWAMALMLREWQSWSLVIQCSAVLGIIGVCLFHLIVGDTSAWWVNYFTKVLADLTKNVDMVTDTQGQQNINQMVALIQSQHWLTIFSKFWTGLTLAINLTLSLLNLLLARWWQAYLFNPGGLRKELYQIRISMVASAVLIIVLLSIWGEVKIAWDILPLVVLPFFPVALSLVHYVSALSKHSWGWLIGFYLLLILFSPYSLIALVLISFVDSFLNLRLRLPMPEVLR